MKLRDIYIICKENVSALENIKQITSNIFIENDTVTIITGPKSKQANTYRVSGLDGIISTLNRLYYIKFLNTWIDDFLEAIPIHGVRKIDFDEEGYRKFLLAKENLLSSVKCLISLCETIGLSDEKIIGMDIKLPICSDFSDLKKNIDDLEFILTKCPFFQHESETLKFRNIDVGSTWLTFAVAGISAVAGGSILLNNIAAFIDKCTIISSHRKTIEKQISDLENDEFNIKEKEAILKYLNQTYKKTVDIAIKELEESTNHKLVDGDERGRVEQAFERLERLLDKGLQIYSTIDSPSETKALFQPLEMKYLEIETQLKLLEKKDDPNNN